MDSLSNRYLGKKDRPLYRRVGREDHLKPNPSRASLPLLLRDPAPRKTLPQRAVRESRAPSDKVWRLIVALLTQHLKRRPRPLGTRRAGLSVRSFDSRKYTGQPLLPLKPRTKEKKTL